MPKPRVAYDLLIVLLDVEPPVWRRVLVPIDLTLPDLHHVLQISMGWGNHHLHCFETGEQTYGPETDEPEFDGTNIDEVGKKLDLLLNEDRDRIQYNYDFGDGWEHIITLEDDFEINAQQPLPVCIDGEGACPPEDVGGPPGYADFLAALNDTSHPKHQEFLNWAGGSFEPEFFDIHTTNVLLGKYVA